MKVTSLHTRDTLSQYLQKNVLQLSCDYFMVIERKDYSSSYTTPSGLAGSRVIRPVDSEVPVLIKSFSIPNSDINFSADDLGHIETKGITYASKTSITFYAANKGASPIETLYNAQFSGGVPLFIPHSQLPKITIYRITAPAEEYSTFKQTFSVSVNAAGDLVKNDMLVTKKNQSEATPVCVLSGCRFSRPMPSVSLSSDQPVEYTCDIYFEDFEIK